MDSDNEEIQQQSEEEEEEVSEEERLRQEFRAQMREDYIRILLAMRNHRVELNLRHNVTTAATFQSISLKTKGVIVKDLVLPLGGIQPAALIRGKDIISMKFTAKK